MPWEKSFDIDQAVDRATNVFWAKGYEATSLSDLLKATGINKGSFYNAFGSKKKLFIQGLLKYALEQHRATLARLSALEDPILALSTLFDALIAQSESDTERKGCFLINTALDLPNQDEDTRRIVSSALAEIEAFFKQQIELGHHTGAFPKHVNSATASKGLLGLVVGLRVLARGVYDQADLQAIKKEAMGLVR